MRQNYTSHTVQLPEHIQITDASKLHITRSSVTRTNTDNRCLKATSFGNEIMIFIEPIENIILIYSKSNPSDSFSMML